VKQDHPEFLVDLEKHPRDTVLEQLCTNFVPAATHRPANRHPDRPAKLGSLYIFADAFSILR
jgi:hypothetical protein